MCHRVDTARVCISIHALLAESDPSSTRKFTNIIISIHALRAESDPAKHTNLTSGISISIHALLAESDRVESGQRHLTPNFYPRSPCGERRLQIFLYYQDNRFLSTLSLRRATRKYHIIDRVRAYISIHALLAESDKQLDLLGWLRVLISIHALLAESDSVVFLLLAVGVISIHALLAESDSKSAQNSGALLRI